MASHKRNVKRLVILERRKNVAKRYLRGETQWEIARAFEVDQATISTDLKAIQKEWLAQAVLDRGEWTARELARLDEVERQAWAAWTKSQENAETLRAKTRGDKGETEKIVKGQAGDPRFLEIVLKCVTKRCELLGLDVPKPSDYLSPAFAFTVETVDEHGHVVTVPTPTSSGANPVPTE